MLYNFEKIQCSSSQTIHVRTSHIYFVVTITDTAL